MAEESEELFADVGAEVPEPVEQPIEQPVEEAPVEELIEPVEEPQAEPVVAPEKPEAGYIPIAAMMDERDKRKAAEARLAQLEQQQQQAPAAPNPFDDPDGYAEHQARMVEERLTQERFAMSDMFARQQHGAETVEKAVEWASARAASDPAFAMSYMRQQNPIDWIVQQHKRDALLSDIGDVSKLDDWFAREAAKRGYAAVGAPVAATGDLPVAQPKPAVPPVKVPRSLATQGTSPSDIRDVATGPLAAVDSVFTE